MKTIFLLGIYLISFIIIYMMFSFVGWMLFSRDSYLEFLRNETWSMIYTLFLGWWMSIFPSKEYYLLHEKHFDRLF